MKITSRKEIDHNKFSFDLSFSGDENNQSVNNA